MVAPAAPHLVIFLDLKIYQNYDLCYDREPDLYLDLCLSRSNDLLSDPDASWVVPLPAMNDNEI